MNERSPGTRSPRRGAVAYWVAAGMLIAFGIVAILSIGMPFLILGLVLVALGPIRHRVEVFVPLLGGVLAFLLVTILVSPWSCTETGAGTTCSSLIGIHVSGGQSYRPAQWPGFLIGGGAGVAVALIIRAALSHLPTRMGGQARPR